MKGRGKGESKAPGDSCLILKEILNHNNVISIKGGSGAI